MKQYHGSMTRVELLQGIWEGFERFLSNIVKVACLQSTDRLSFQVDLFTLVHKERHSTGTPMAQPAVFVFAWIVMTNYNTR